MFLAHMEPVVSLGLNEWLFVLLASACIFVALGPAVIRKLRSSDD